MAKLKIAGTGPNLKTNGNSNIWIVGSDIKKDYEVKIDGTTRSGVAVHWAGKIVNCANDKCHAQVSFVKSGGPVPVSSDDLADVTITVTNDSNPTDTDTHPVSPLAAEVVVIDGP